MRKLMTLLGLHSCSIFAAPWFTGGCATVDPRPDFDRLGREIADATGEEAIYRPEEDETMASEVEKLLADGLTVEDAVQIALMNNPTLQAAFMDVGMRRADVVQSGLLANPMLGGAMVRFPSGGGLAMIEADLAQDIAHLWRIPVRKRAAERELDRAILSLARQAATLAAETKTAYYRSVGADQIHEIAEENLALARQLAELALARQLAGAGDQLDVNLVRGLVLDGELAVETARLAAGEARRTLARALGLTSKADELRLVSALPAAGAVAADAESLVETARLKRRDLQAAERAVEAAEARWREEVLRVFPTLSLGVSFERGARRSEEGQNLLMDTARASAAAGQFTLPEIERPEKQRQDFMIGPVISMELPIFDQNQAQIAKARFAYQQAAKTWEALDRAIVQEVRSAADQTASAWRIAALYREQWIPLADSNLELSRASYVAGKAGFLTVLEAQRSALTTRSRSIEALQAAAVTLPALENAVGAPLSQLQGEGERVAINEKATHEANREPLQSGPTAAD